MKILSFFTKKRLIGLDIQPHGIYLVQLKHSPLGIELLHLAMRELAPGIFHHGKIHEWDALTAALLELNQALKLRGMATAISLPAHLVNMQHLQIPADLPNTDIEVEIAAHLRKHLPGLNEVLAIDYIEPAIAQPTQLFFAATRQAYLEQYVQCVQTAGFAVKIVDIDIYAITRAISHALAAATQTAMHAYIHVNQHMAIFIIFDAAAIYFHQTCDISETTELLAQLSQINFTLAALITCDNSAATTIIAEKIAALLQLKICYLAPFAHLQTSKTNNSTILPTADFSLACGLSLREAAKW